MNCFFNTNCSRIVHELFTNWTELMGQLMGQLMGINGEPHVEVWKALPFREGLGVGFQKSNNFERFFGDLTLTFLTSRNTFRLVILPIRRIILLCLPLIKIWGRQRKIWGRQILTGCASKIPDFKGKVTKKGGGEAPPISLYKYNTFRRQKQEVLKPK